VNQQPITIGCHLPSNGSLPKLPEVGEGFLDPGLFDK
jgi:hypothetical protein